MLTSLRPAIRTSAVAVMLLWLGCDRLWTPFLDDRPSCQTDPAACALQDGGAADGLPFDGLPSDAGTEPPPVCSKDGWCLENTTSPKQDLWQVWGSDASNVWAVGGTKAPSGVILKRSGTSWSVAYSGATPLTGIWGSSASNIWAVGYAGTILKWNGSAWSLVTSGSTKIL